MKIIVLIMLSVYSLAGFAHSGHGDSSLFAHDLDHTLWALGGIILLLLGFLLARR